MTYKELIEEAGAVIGIEGFTPDDDGVCTLVSDIGEIVIMDCKSPKETVLLNAVWREGGKATLMSLFSAVQAWRGGNGTSAEIE